MWYVTDKDQHMDPRCFGDLTLLLKTIFIDSPALVARYITECSLLEPITSLDLPFDCGSHSIGELTAAWARENGEWDNLVWRVADAVADEVVDCFENFQPGDTEICYIGNIYAITKD